MLKYDQYWKLVIMRQHEINKRKKLKQKRRESSKSQVEKKHKRRFKGKRRS